MARNLRLTFDNLGNVGSLARSDPATPEFDGRTCMPQVIKWSGFAAALGLAWGITTAPTMATPVYTLSTKLAVPASAANPFASGQFNTYDIGFFDPTTQLYYLADRTNASVD